MILYVVASLGPLVGPEVHFDAEVHYDRRLAASTWRDWCMEGESEEPKRLEIEGLMERFVRQEGLRDLFWIGDPDGEPDMLNLHVISTVDVPNLQLIWSKR